MSAAPTLQVHPKLRAIELRRVSWLALGGLVMGGNLFAFAVWRAWRRSPQQPLADFAIACACTFAAFLVSRATWKEMRVSLDRLESTRRLATEGRLTTVDLLTCHKEDGAIRAMLRYTFRTPDGATHEAGIAVSEGGAYRVDESERKSLALLSSDGRQALLLTRSGYPLSNATEALARASATKTQSAR